VINHTTPDTLTYIADLDTDTGHNPTVLTIHLDRESQLLTFRAHLMRPERGRRPCLIVPAEDIPDLLFSTMELTTSPSPDTP